MTSIIPTHGDALLLVDVQNDFLPGGSLAVPRSDEILEPLNGYLAAFGKHGLPVAATRDWHPADHCSFRSHGGEWPPHCIAGTFGAAFPERLALPSSAIIISKAEHREREAYSGFQNTDLAARLVERDVRRLFVGGLATDYCVLKTVEDALLLGYEVLLLADAMRAVELNSGDGQRALERMQALGARSIERRQIAD